MAFKQVADLDADKTTALGGFNKSTGKPNPKQVEGYYLGVREVENKKGTANLYFLQTPEGNLGVWGKTDLNKKMKAVPPGAMVRLTHTGMLTTKNGDMYKYKVEVDADNSIDVSMIAGASDSSDDSESQDDESTGYGAESDEEEQEYTPPPAAARPNNSASKVQELLAKRNKK